MAFLCPGLVKYRKGHVSTILVLLLMGNCIIKSIVYAILVLCSIIRALVEIVPFCQEYI